MLFKLLLLLLLLFHIPAQLFVFHYNFSLSSFTFLGRRGGTHRFFFFFFSRRCLKLRLLPKVTNFYRKASNSLRRGVVGRIWGARVSSSGEGRALRSLFCFCLLAAIYGGKQVALDVVYKYIISKQRRSLQSSL